MDGNSSMSPDGSGSAVDIIIGSILILSVVVGLPGNIFAQVYFWSNERKSIADKLYIIIISVDIGTLLASLPVIVSLLNNRDPILFAVPFVCGCFTIIAYFLLRMSMFLVAVMSVTRSFAIVAPHRSRMVCTKKKIRSGIVAYALFLLIVDGIFFAMGWMKGTYFRTLRSYCSYDLTKKSPKWVVTFFHIAFEIEIILPSIVVFISFVTGTISLIRNASTTLGSENTAPRLSEEQAASTSISRVLSVQSTCDGEKIFRQVSITITLFTAVFLVCNIPLFVYQMLYLLTKLIPSMGKDVANLEFHQKYAHLLCLVMPYVINAALNPCLYLMRMPRYREQFLSWGRGLQQRMCGLCS